MAWRCAAPLILLIPLYIFPTPDVYSQVAKAGGLAVAIVTGANSGPPDPNSRDVLQYDAAFKQLSDAGVGLAGYVSTAYGARPLPHVVADIRAWYDQHGGQMAGIFLDEYAEEATPAVLAYYRAASAEVKSRGAQQLVIANPGLVPARSLALLVNIPHPHLWVDTPADVVLTFEGPYSDWFATGLPRSGRKQTRDTVKTAALVYGNGNLDASALQRQMLRAQLLGYSYVYFTDGTMPDPWGQLPGYFDEELTALQAVQQNATF